MKSIPIAVLLMLGLFTGATGAQSLKVGDKAPPLAGGEFVQGDPVTEFEAGKVYVVEMWATWCGPCIGAIPHINDLQKKNEDDGLVIIGQNVWEKDTNKVAPFIEKMGERMSYRVVLDRDETMATTWMEAAGQTGIPKSFIVDRQGKLAWMGHPMLMDVPLKQILAGTVYPAADEGRRESFEATLDAYELQFKGAEKPN